MEHVQVLVSWADLPFSLGCTCKKEKDPKACSVLEWCEGIDPSRLHYQLVSKSLNTHEEQSLSTTHAKLPLACKKMMRPTHARAGSWDAFSCSCHLGKSCFCPDCRGTSVGHVRCGCRRSHPSPGGDEPVAPTISVSETGPKLVT